MPLDPGRLSTITGCLKASCSPCATSRAVISVEAPGDCGTMMRIGRSGYCCPNAPVAPNARTMQNRCLMASPCPTLLYREGIHRRAHRAGDRQRRRDEQELVALVLGAVARERGEVEDLAHRESHDRDRDPVPRLVGVLGLVRAHFRAPGIGGDAGDLLLVEPVDR